MTGTGPDDDRLLANHPDLKNRLIDIGIGFCVVILVVYGSIGVYALLAATALGPIVVGSIRRPAVAAPAQQASAKESR